VLTFAFEASTYHCGSADLCLQGIHISLPSRPPHITVEVLISAFKASTYLCLQGIHISLWRC